MEIMKIYKTYCDLKIFWIYLINISKADPKLRLYMATLP